MRDQLTPGWSAYTARGVLSRSFFGRKLRREELLGVKRQCSLCDYPDSVIRRTYQAFSILYVIIAGKNFRYWYECPKCNSGMQYIDIQTGKSIAKRSRAIPSRLSRIR